MLVQKYLIFNPSFQMDDSIVEINIGALDKEQRENLAKILQEALEQVYSETNSKALQKVENYTEVF